MTLAPWFGEVVSREFESQSLILDVQFFIRIY